MEEKNWPDMFSNEVQSTKQVETISKYTFYLCTLVTLTWKNMYFH